MNSRWNPVRSGATILLCLLALTGRSALAKTFAIVIGISQYNNETLEWVPFADHDARFFQSYVSLGDHENEPSLILINQRAKLAEIREALQYVERNARPTDEVYIFISARGMSPSYDREGRIYPFDGGNTNATSLTVSRLKSFLSNPDIGRVFLFADVCREGGREENRINIRLAEMSPRASRFQTVLASQPRERSKTLDDLSANGERGYGVFGYALASALQDAASAGRRVTVDDLYRIVKERVKDELRKRKRGDQEPYYIGTPTPGQYLTRLSPPAPILLATTFFFPGLLAQLGRLETIAGSVVGRLPEQIVSALDARNLALAQNRFLDFETNLQSADRPEARRTFAVLLEQRGQNVLLRYGEGDQFPDDPQRPQQRDFNWASDMFRTARDYRPADPECATDAASLRAACASERQTLQSLDARRLFCEGRSLLFDRRFDLGRERLDAALKLDENFAEAWNALGINHLEQAGFDEAIPAFEHAISVAPLWAYARHNLALTYIESGNYRAAEREYLTAIARAPDRAYLYYNLGLLLHRLNRLEEAERQYRWAIDTFNTLMERGQSRAEVWRGEGAQAEADQASERVRILLRNQAEAHNALGALLQARGHRRDADREYELALKGNPGLTAALYNRGVLAMDTARNKPNRPGFKQAIGFWEEARKLNPNEFAVRLKLGEAYHTQGDYKHAAEEFQQARELRKTYSPAQAQYLEALADERFDQGNTADACGGYQSAVDLGGDRQIEKRIRRKLRDRCK